MFISLLINGEYEVTGEKYLTRELCYYDEWSSHIKGYFSGRRQIE